MRVSSVIAEFNPYHNGHSYLVSQIREQSGCDFVVAVMSGNFVQRGESAVCDKWTRAQMCLADGVDMVLELPVISATASAERFANGAISILTQTNCVDYLFFGAEDDHFQILNEAACCLAGDNPAYDLLMRQYLQKGISYPAARQNALANFLPLPDGLLTKPNNILAIEYCKALKRWHSPITPHAIKRISSGYHDTALNLESGISSATAIRNAVKKNNLSSIQNAMPAASYEIFRNALSSGWGPVWYDDFSACLQYAIRSQSSDQLREISDITEGLENRIKNCAEKNFLISDLVMAVKSKRYTFTRIQRSLLHILLGITKEAVRCTEQDGHGYVRVLGLKKSARPLLSVLTKKSSVPVLINLADNKKVLDAYPLYTLNLDLLSTDIYALCLPDTAKRQTSLDLTRPIVLSN